MKVKIQQFLGQCHSWSVCGQNIARALIKDGHDVHLQSTNGYLHFPKDLLPFVKETLDKDYDAQISYTVMKNFPLYLRNGLRNRFGIWNYEFDILPEGMAKYATMVDKFLPSSTFFYDICIKNKIPAEQMTVVPHGVDWESFASAEPFPLKTDKKYKFLMNFGQPHIRKNLAGTLEAFGRAFNKKDDVCLVIKAADLKPSASFEVSFREIFQKFKTRFPNHAECLIITQYISSIESLYRSCDALFMLPHAEAFFLPALEMLAANGLVITSNYGGQLDFLNHDNSFLIDGKMIRAPLNAQYWSPSIYASMFQPDLDQASQILQHCLHNMEDLKTKKLSSLQAIKEKFSWSNVAKILSELSQN